jgi:carbon-monoxide dehydrogenase medium subunit
VKPSAFGYVRPGTLDEAVGILADGDVLLAGGQSLIPDLNERRRFARRLVDLNGVTGLDTIEFRSAVNESAGNESAGNQPAATDRVRLGALVRHRDLAGRDDVRAAVPVLAEAARHVGHEAIRTRGTLTGSIANADPAAELPGVCVLLGAVARVRSAAGERTVPVADLLRPGGLGAQEVITATSVPTLLPGEGWGFRELSRPGAYAFPLVTVSATLRCAVGGAVTGLRAAVTGAAPVPYTLPDSTAAGLLGGGPGWTDAAADDWATAAAAELAAIAEPVTDHYASAAYRRRMVRHLARQALADALRRAGPGAPATGTSPPGGAA